MPSRQIERPGGNLGAKDRIHGSTKEIVAKYSAGGEI